MSIPVNPVVVGEATKKSNFDTLYNGTVLVNTGGTPGGAQSIPGAKTFDDKTTFSSGFIASGTCTYYAPVAGEESAGTLHFYENTSPWMLVNGVTFTSAWIDVPCASYIPSNAKGVYLLVRYYVSGSGSTTYENIGVRKKGDSSTLEGSFVQVGTDHASSTNAGGKWMLSVAVDDDLIFQYKAWSNNDSYRKAWISVEGYYI